MRKLFGGVSRRDAALFKRNRKKSATGARSTPGVIRYRIVVAALITVGVSLIGVASYFLVTWQLENKAARSEYEQLSEQYPVSSYLISMADDTDDPDSETSASSSGPTAPGIGVRMPGQSEDGEQNPIEGLLALNPDFVGWITIEDVIDYPVVRGRNNSHYLYRTFTGQANAAGSIFMDYRHTSEFKEPVCVLYGHNMSDGSMFASLHKYRDPAYLAEHPVITVITSEAEVLTYQIYAVRITATGNAFHAFEYQSVSTVARYSRAPEGTDRILILSTCTRHRDPNERLQVFAALTSPEPAA